MFHFLPERGKFNEMKKDLLNLGFRIPNNLLLSRGICKITKVEFPKRILISFLEI